MLSEMGVRIPKPILDNGPPMILSASAGVYLGRFFSLRSQSTTEHVKFLSFWPLLFIAIFIVALGAWWWRSSINEKVEIQRQKVADDRDRKIDEIHNVLIPAPSPEVVAAEGLDVARGVGTSITLNPGDTFSMAIGAGPATVTVPSGGMFGPDSPETIEFTLDNRQHYLTLPHGGTVRIVATATGQSEITGTAKGTKTDPSADPEEQP